MRYNINEVKVLTEEDYVKEKLKRNIQACKEFGFEPLKEKIEIVTKRYHDDYNKLLNNNYDVGGLIPAFVKVKQIVLYQDDFCFIDDKNKLYYIN